MAITTADHQRLKAELVEYAIVVAFSTGSATAEFRHIGAALDAAPLPLSRPARELIMCSRHDRAGLMQTRSRVSSLVGKHICTENYITDQTRLVPPHEYNSELNYTLARLPGVYVMPNVQYVRNPVASSPTKAR